MMSYHRSDFESASQWLAALRQDDAWLSQLRQLQTADESGLYKRYQIASQKIEASIASDFWFFYEHRVEKVVEELWETGEVTLPTLKVQTIWLLTLEWLEKERKGVIERRKELVEKLKNMFFGDEKKIDDFLKDIMHMKAQEITNRVNLLVSKRVISDMARKRDLWQVLHDYGLYDKTEANWNQQVK